MRILHLSDFHFRSGVKDLARQSLIIDSMIEKLKGYSGTIDFLLFTGDLVFSGEKANDFQDACDQLIKPVSVELNIQKRNVFYCAGNHDVNRKKVVDPIRDYIRKVSSSKELTKIVEENHPNIYGLSYQSTDNFRTFISNFYPVGVKNETDHLDTLFTIHYRECDKKKIAFVSLNTAWQSSGSDDRGNLFFPKSELEKAIYYVKKANVDWKVLLLHHPISDLRDFNKTDIEDLIYSEFHFLFSGHLHKREDFIRLTMNEGIFGSYAHAAFTHKDEGKIGFSILDIDFNTLEIFITKSIYDYEERVFVNHDAIKFIFPCNEEKSDQIRIYQTLRKRYNETLEKANELFVVTKDLENQFSFLELFIDPVLRTEPNLEAGIQLKYSPRFDNKKLLEKENYLIYGKDKTGKTSLLYHIMIQLLRQYSQISQIPFYLNLADHKANPAKLDIVKLLSRYLEHNLESTKKLIKKYNIKILIDNYDPNQKEILAVLAKFFDQYKECSYIILADQTLPRSLEQLDYGLGAYKLLFIHDISRREIRQLTRKWPNIPDIKREEFIDTIIGVLNQHSMPFNFWTLSIFLFIYSGKNTLNFNNNSELIELYIDDLLDRNRLASDPQNRFSYQNYKLYLSALAYKILTEYKSSNYTMKYAELVAFTEDFIKQNPKRVSNTSEIIEYLLEKGVFKRLEYDFLTFRLNGVFEYFIAYGFNENKEFLNKILNDDDYYLSFKNEFEIYSGFQRSESENKEFLRIVFEKTKKVFKELNERMEGNLDLRLYDTLNDKPTLDFTKSISQLASSGIDPLTDEEKDTFYEENSTGINKVSDVRPKKVYDVSTKNCEILERYLVINGRVFRNIENVNDKKLISDVFDFLIDASCNLGFALIEEMETSEDESFLKEFKHKDLKRFMVELINNYLPSVVQNFIHDSMGHINLEVIVQEKIKFYKMDPRNNQYKLFILNSLLLDIDLRKYKFLIDEMIEQCRLSVMRSSLLLKLISLLLFKCYDDDKMIGFLKEKLREINILINPKIDMTKFELQFDRAYKAILLKRQINQ